MRLWPRLNTWRNWRPRLDARLDARRSRTMMLDAWRYWTMMHNTPEVPEDDA